MPSKAYESQIEEISGYLKQIAEAFPRPAECYPRFEQAVSDLADGLLHDLDPDKFEPDPEALEHADSIADQPIFICGQMKTGTNLMMTLLDGHPEIFVPAVGSHYLLTESKWNRDEFREMAVYWLRHIIMPTTQEPFWFLGPERGQFESFLNHLHYFVNRRPYDLFVCAILAMLLSHRKDTRARFWVEKTTQNELHARKLLERFPKALFIHSIRDPMTNLTSLKRNYESRGKKFRVKPHTSRLRRMIRAGTENENAIGPSRYRIIRYEDLVRHPEETMKSLTAFLGIEYSETLLIPTENGRPATSNSMYKEQRVQGKIVDFSANKHYLKELTATEIVEIREKLHREAERYGYDWSDISAHPRRQWFFSKRK